MPKKQLTLKEETELLLKEIKKMGKSRNDIAKFFGMQATSINSGLSRGGSEELYGKIKTYRDYIKSQQPEATQLLDKIEMLELKTSIMVDLLVEVLSNQKGVPKSSLFKKVEKIIKEGV